MLKFQIMVMGHMLSGARGNLLYKENSEGLSLCHIINAWDDFEIRVLNDSFMTCQKCIRLNLRLQIARPLVSVGWVSNVPAKAGC